MADPDAKRKCFEQLDARVGPIQSVIGGAKTGTATIGAGLRQVGVEPIRSHTLEPERLAASEASYVGDAEQLRRIWEAQWLTAHPPSEERPWALVTTVRDPVARMVSSFFHQRTRAGVPREGLAVDLLLEELTRRSEDEVVRLAARPPDWFDLNISDRAGVRLYDHPFDHELGYGRVVTDRIEVLVLRTESLVAASGVLGDFFGVGGRVTLATENTTSGGPYGDLFKTAMQQFCLPAEWAARMYRQPLAQHFYSEEELASFQDRWTRPRAG